MKLTTTSRGPEISWNLGPCQSIGTYGDNIECTQTCCLATGSYTLKCKDSGIDGWHGGYIEVYGLKYCDNFLSGSEQTSQITLESNGKYFSYFASILTLTTI